MDEYYQGAYSGPQIDEAIGKVLNDGGLVPNVGKGINLLDNWYFVGGGSQQGGGQFPINQQGQTVYSGSGYTIDRWKITESPTSLTVNSGYITVSASGGIGSIRQILENFDYSLTYTISMLLRDGTLATASGMCSPNQNITVYINGSPLYLIYLGHLIFDIQNGSSFDIIAAKLELGDTQTLAHQENGVWVLNDPPPNYQQELAKCQRYYYCIEAESAYATMATGVCTDSTLAEFVFFHPVFMASAPTVSVSGIFATNSTSFNGASLSNTVSRKNSTTLKFQSNLLTKGYAVTLQDGGPATAKIEFSANL